MRTWGRLWEHLRLYEAECLGLLERGRVLLGDEGADGFAVKRFPVLGAYELALKCSHLFNLLDARGAISVTERVGVMARIRTLVVGVAKMYAAQGTCTCGLRAPAVRAEALRASRRCMTAAVVQTPPFRDETARGWGM